MHFINFSISGKIGLITYLQVLENCEADKIKYASDIGELETEVLKYSVCCSLPIIEAMCAKFSHVLH